MAFLPIVNCLKARIVSYFEAGYQLLPYYLEIERDTQEILAEIIKNWSQNWLLNSFWISLHMLLLLLFVRDDSKLLVTHLLLSKSFRLCYLFWLASGRDTHKTTSVHKIYAMVYHWLWLDVKWAHSKMLNAFVL